MLTVFASALGRRTKHSESWTSTANVSAATDVLDAVQSVVDAITDGRGGRYTAGFIDKGEGLGATSLSARRIVITTKPLRDPNLKRLDQIAEVITGIVCHEIGHTIYSVQTEAIITRRWSTNTVAKVVANVLDDHRLERRMRVDYPGIAPTFKPTRKWVVSQNPETEPIRSRGAADSITVRVNFAITAVRYAPFVPWSADPLTRAERQWWQGWAQYFTETDEDALIEDGIATALDRLRNPAEPPVEDTDEPTDTEDDESEDEDEDDDEDDDDDTLIDDDEDDDESDDDGDGEGNDDDDDGERPGESYIDEDDLDEDAESEAESDPGPDGGCKTGTSGGDDLDGEGDSDDGESSTERKTGSSGDGDGGKGGGEIDVTDIADGEVEHGDDVDEKDIVKGIDDLNDDHAGATIIERMIDEARKTERIAMGDGWGSMKIKIAQAG